MRRWAGHERSTPRPWGDCRGIALPTSSARWAPGLTRCSAAIHADGRSHGLDGDTFSPGQSKLVAPVGFPTPFLELDACESRLGRGGRAPTCRLICLSPACCQTIIVLLQHCLRRFGKKLAMMRIGVLGAVDNGQGTDIKTRGCA